ncbi:hypothetical protein DICSQDRAFT_156353, partial [Dichomitus squalens LYAD-421 SS1]
MSCKHTIDGCAAAHTAHGHGRADSSTIVARDDRPLGSRLRRLLPSGRRWHAPRCPPVRDRDPDVASKPRRRCTERTGRRRPGESSSQLMSLASPPAIERSREHV